jgi:hypothetical protein
VTWSQRRCGPIGPVSVLALPGRPTPARDAAPLAVVPIRVVACLGWVTAAAAQRSGSVELASWLPTASTISRRWDGSGLGCRLAAEDQGGHVHGGEAVGPAPKKPATLAE